jgi:hypothetical protein
MMLPKVNLEPKALEMGNKLIIIWHFDFAVSHYF